MQQAISEKVNRQISLFVRCAITQDVAAAGSANLLPTVNLDGHFIAANVTANVRMTETAEQTLRELLVTYGQTFELEGVQLIHLPIGPVIVATVSGARPPVPSQVRFVEETIRKRLGDPTATLLVRATTTSDITNRSLTCVSFPTRQRPRRESPSRPRRCTSPMCAPPSPSFQPLYLQIKGCLLYTSPSPRD